MNSRSQRAFTLLEILLVVIIIALFAGMVMFSLAPNDNKVLKNEARRLFQVIKLAQDEAIIQDVEMGLTIQPTQYFFSQLEKDKWELLEDKQFGTHKLVEGIKLLYVIDGDAVMFLGKDEDEVRLSSPKIILLSSGEMIPFTIKIGLLNQNAMYQIMGQEDGLLSFENSTKP